MSIHTPEPWYRTGGNIWVETETKRCCEDRTDGVCCGNPVVELDQVLIAECREQDAPLITTAPRLLATLKSVLESGIWKHTEWCKCSKCAEIRAVIAEAEGEIDNDIHPARTVPHDRSIVR